MSRRARVLVVDDSVVIRRLVSEMLGSDPRIEVVGTASNGKVALERVVQLTPDLVVLDVEMPEMDGFETLARLRTIAPRLPILMFSAHTERGGALTLEALARGASDYVTKPTTAGGKTNAVDEVRLELIGKVVALTTGGSATDGGIVARREVPVARVPMGVEGRVPAGVVDVVVIAASTGGPNAVSELVRGLSRPFPVPVLIAQHMPPMFTRIFAERLTKESGWLFREGEDGSELRGGEGWVAPGDFHMVVRRDGGISRIGIEQGPPEHSCRPAADPLLRSCAAVYGPGVLAVVLTGMGYDGTRGCEAVRTAGGRVLVQDAASCVVPSMPNSVRQAGLAHAEFPLALLGHEIDRIVARSSRGDGAVDDGPATEPS